MLLVFVTITKLLGVMVSFDEKVGPSLHSPTASRLQNACAPNVTLTKPMS